MKDLPKSDDYRLRWGDKISISIPFYCSYCGRETVATEGLLGEADIRVVEEGRFSQTNENPVLAICPYCGFPTFLFGPVGQIPGRKYGNNVSNITEESVESIYNQARDCYSVGAFTAVLQLCRTLLMHIAVSKGEEPGKTFKQYVTCLIDNGILPKDSKSWVDKIRSLGNDAVHEIHIRTEEEAQNILDFTEMVLKLVYEYPSRAIKGSKQTKP